MSCDGGGFFFSGGYSQTLPLEEHWEHGWLPEHLIRLTLQALHLLRVSEFSGQLRNLRYCARLNDSFSLLRGDLSSSWIRWKSLRRSCCCCRLRNTRRHHNSSTTACSDASAFNSLINLTEMSLRH